MTLWKRIVFGALGLAVFFAAWELLVRAFDIPPFKLRAPSQALREIAGDFDFYVEQSWVTAREAMLGFLLALAAALVWGALMAAFGWIDAATTPILVLVMVTPFATYAPAVVLWRNGGLQAIVFVTALVCLPAFVFATADGMRSAEPAAREVFASVDAKRLEVLWRLRLPSALPSLFTAARWNVGLSLVIAYLMEGYALTTSGLGYWGRKFAAFNSADEVWAVVFCMAALGVMGMLVVSLVRSRVLHWHASERTAR